MQNPLYEQQLALAGVCQAAKLVQSIARTGEADENAVEASISSILVTDPDSTQQVYGSSNNLKIGFTTLIEQIDNSSKMKDAELTRYIASILSLERKLNSNRQALNELANRVSHVQRQSAHVGFENSQILTSLASIYSDVVSPLAPKIQIAGNPEHLSIESNQRKVRTLLLAGIRSAVLWRQLGGKRRHILLSRNKILDSAKQALRSLN
ncbi:high frequency lysogenization protein HflD [Glaciecola sp. XM2]|uniref:high frequency lysogenization protein HflD n=1 Tax=Glaciecola sp. XM2 TaxID=1914931 RepID=UPI001BDDDCA3|nr:high frequency lysogenization protein HflD [Glaciecola sp. XM2]MBT1449364.1 high frequency lysogenization protein HflD [Glaciecola sp. XM2]